MKKNPYDPAPRTGIVTFSAGDGGNDKMLVHLARGLTEQGCKVDFVTRTRHAPYLDMLPPSVNWILLEATSSKGRTAALARYVAEAQPDVLLSGKRSDEETLSAVQRARTNTRVFFRVGTTLSVRNENRGILKTWWRTRRMRHLFPKAHGVIAVSQGVARDVVRFLMVPAEKIHVVPNPVVTPEMQAQKPPVPSHPFYAIPRDIAIVVGMGGFRKQKDFPTLLRAFAMVVRRRPARLILLGQGHLEEKLKALSRSLGIAGDVAFPGFVKDPYGYLAHADLFVLSSLWEGSPNVLTEALALGTPVVATDCPSGPREILQDGRYGRLVPCSNPEAMAQAMEETLKNPPPPDFLKQAVNRYTLACSAREYLRAFGLCGNATSEEPSKKAGGNPNGESTR